MAFNEVDLSGESDDWTDYDEKVRCSIPPITLPYTTAGSAPCWHVRFQKRVVKSLKMVGMGSAL